jgi:hypothetical protein
MHIYDIHHFVHLEISVRQTTFTEVRNHAKQYFDIVGSGEPVRIQRNGKPIRHRSGSALTFLEATQR